MDNEEFISEIYQIYNDRNYFKVIDVNNDKKSDLIIRHLDQNISIVLNNHNGTFLHPIIYLIEFDGPIFLVMDINNDHKIDLIYGIELSKYYLI